MRINTKRVWQEMGATLQDTLAYGDLAGHLAAWWRVATGRVAEEDRVVLGPALAPELPEEQPAGVAPAVEAAGALLRG